MMDPYPGQELTDELRAAVEIEERSAPGPDGAPDVRVLLYRPKGGTGTLPLVLSLHGGAFAMRPDNFPRGDAMVAAMGAVVVAVDYRIVPEHPFPAGVEDCYSVLQWAVDTLDIDAERVILTGASAGGALVGAVTQMARDRRGPAISFQALTVPVTDDRCVTPSMQQFVSGPLFGQDRAVDMWTTYLGTADRSGTSPYAAPNRAEDLSGLPPAFIQVGGWDPLRDEGIEYAIRLMAAGVPVELYCAPRQHHGLSEDPRVAAEAARLYAAAIAAALESPTSTKEHQP